MKSFKNFLNEDAASAGPAPANSMGAGIDGLPTKVDDGITGFDKVMTGQPLRRKPPAMFGGKAVFKVSSDSFHKARLGKQYRKHYKSYVSGELGEEIRQYAIENPNAPIILEDEVTGAMVFLRYGKK